MPNIFSAMRIDRNYRRMKIANRSIWIIWTLMIVIFILTLFYIKRKNLEWKNLDLDPTQIDVRISLIDSSMTDKNIIFPLELQFNDTNLIISDTFESIGFKTMVKYNRSYKFILKDCNDRLISTDSLRELKNCLILYDIKLTDNANGETQFKVEAISLYYP